MAVCSIEYINNEYTAQEAGYVAQLHDNVETSFRDLAGPLIKKGNNNSTYFSPKSKATDVYAKLNSVMSKVNEMYGGKVVNRSKNNKGSDIYRVNVNPIAQERLFHHKDAVRKIEQDGYGVNELGDIQDKSNLKRAYNLDTEENLEGLEKKAVAMQRTFEANGLNTFVILDGDLNASGAVLSQNDSKVKELIASGDIDANTKVISLNPNQLMTDTVFHEYGHLFIDIAGGMENARMRAAYNKLVGTKHYNTVKELYPELSEESDNFKKEVIATALGHEANNVFESKDNRNWWNRFFDWISEKVYNALGIERDVVRNLAKEMLGGQFQVNQNTTFNQDTMFKKPSKQVNEVRQQANAAINSLQSANKQIVKRINEMVRAHEAGTGKTLTMENRNEAAEGRKMYEFKVMSDLFDKLSENKQTEFLLNFVTSTAETVNKQTQFLNNRIADLENGVKLNIDSVTIMMTKAYNYNEAFGIVQKVKANIASFKGLTDEQRTALNQSLTESINGQSELLNSYRRLGKMILVDKFMSMEDIMFAEIKERLQIEYNTTKNDADSRVANGETKEEFIRRIINEEREEILEDTREFVTEELDHTLVDIGDIELMVRSENSMNDMMIRMVKKIADKADFDRDQAFLPIRDLAVQVFKEYRAKFGSADMKKMYDPIMEHASDGTSYLLGEYNIEYMETSKKLNNAVFDAEEKRSKAVTPEEIKKANKELRAAEKARNKWSYENSEKVDVVVDGDKIDETYKPIDKWKNKRYQTIMSKPDSPEAKMLQFLTRVAETSEANLNGKKSLKRSSGMAEWHRLPAMGRDTIEKLTGGNYAENIKDNFERMYKFMDDDQEVGNMHDGQEAGKKNSGSRHFKNVLGNIASSEKHNIPIHFRGKFDSKTHSYDLLTSYLTDLYMSENYKAKSAAHPAIELILNLSKDRTYNHTQGFKDLIKRFGGDEQTLNVLEAMKGEKSNVHKKLHSMVDNRFYGIETINSEYAKLSQTIMKWTGSTMLALNFYAGIANVMQGKVMNTIEAIGGQFFNKQDLVTGEGKYWRDFGGHMDDLHSNTKVSRTGQMTDTFDPQGEFRGIHQKFIKDNAAKKYLQSKNLAAFNHLGEHWVQGTLMYSILNNIKPMTKDGMYLDRNLRPTKDKSKAISLDEAITFENGVAKIDPQVHMTTFSDQAEGDHAKILLETRSLIKKISSDLHGQYDSAIQSHLQRTAVGKMLFMLRKWIVPGFDRRWRGTIHTLGSDYISVGETTDINNRHKRFYSSDLKSFQEGTYATAIKVFRTLVRDGEGLQFWAISNTDTWNNMTDMEKSNFNKAVAEWTTIALSLFAAWALKGLASELPDEDATALYMGAFAFRRLHQELVSYVNPIEAITLMRSPAASLSMVEKGLSLMGQSLFDGARVITGGDAEVYQSGRRKGDLKIMRKLNQVLPVLSQTDRTVQDAAGFVFQNY